MTDPDNEAVFPMENWISEVAWERVKLSPLRRVELRLLALPVIRNTQWASLRVVSILFPRRHVRLR